MSSEVARGIDGTSHARGAGSEGPGGPFA
jgi:hypothetical protein